MKKLIVAATFAALPLSSFAADVTTTVGAERSLESEVNTLYGSLGYGIATLGATMEDTATDSGQFNIQKYELDFSQPVGPVTLYMKNDFDDGMKHTETVIGGKISF